MKKQMIMAIQLICVISAIIGLISFSAYFDQCQQNNWSASQDQQAEVKELFENDKEYYATLTAELLADGKISISDYKAFQLLKSKKMPLQLAAEAEQLNSSFIDLETRK